MGMLRYGTVRYGTVEVSNFFCCCGALHLSTLTAATYEVLATTGGSLLGAYFRGEGLGSLAREIPPAPSRSSSFVLLLL